MKLIKNNLTNLVIFMIVLISVWLRATWYGDLKLSIANAETDSYINSSKNSIFSWKIFAGQRLFTTNLIYKLTNESEDCPITAYGKPGIGQEDIRDIQLCFDEIILFQNIVAIFGWALLAWTTAKWVQNPFIKVIAAGLILLFGFTPQIAEWDSILTPESLSLSMFAITLSLAQETAFRIARVGNPFSTRNEKLLLIGWLLLFLLWVFVRDVHLYAIPVTLALLVLLFLLKEFRNTKNIFLASTILFVMFVIGFVSARDSLRATRYPLINALDAYIWPYPQRVDYFKSFGMPERTAPNYQDWADINASKAYGLFLLSHPGFVATTLWENLDQLTSDFVQPYFITPEVQHRETLLIIGKILHPETPSIYLISAIILLALVVQAIQFREPSLISWAWLAIWFLSIAAVTLFLSFFGDTAGTRRHIMPSVEMIRLFLWVFLIPFLDLSLKQLKQTE